MMLELAREILTLGESCRRTIQDRRKSGSSTSFRFILIMAATSSDKKQKVKLFFRLEI